MAQVKSKAGWFLWAIGAVVVIVLAFVIYLNGAKAQSVATVNGEKITKEDLYQRLIQQDGGQTLNTMITDALIRQQAKKAGVTASDQDVQQEIDKIKKNSNFTSDAQLEQALAQYGASLSDFKDQVRSNLIVKKILLPQIKVTDADVKKFYDDNKSNYEESEQVKASHILVTSLDEAKQIKQQLDQGADFAELAKEKSLDTANKDKGGELGYFGKGQMAKEFETVAFTLKPGQISDPVQTQYGYHIIKVEDHKQAATPTYDQIKERVRQDYIDQQVQQKATSWLDEVRTKSKIDNKLEGEQPKPSQPVPGGSPAPAAK